jgi:hypothetical protein
MKPTHSAASKYAPAADHQLGNETGTLLTDGNSVTWLNISIPGVICPDIINKPSFTSVCEQVSSEHPPIHEFTLSR